MHSRIMVSLLIAFAPFATPSGAEAKKPSVITTLQNYASIAKQIAGNRANVAALARGQDDPHFVRPKPSLAVMLRRADLLISTGLDLEMWLPALLDRAANPKIRSGQPGFVSASRGVALLDRPKTVSRGRGDVHIYGNPHIYSGPLNGKIIARNITIGLSKIDPAGAAVYQRNYERFCAQLDRRMFGAKLLPVLGSALLTKLALGGRLIPFLRKKRFRGKPLIGLLGGWMGKALPLYGQKIVTYHLNWAYFAKTFGLEIIGTVESKPGIPPSPGHVARLIAEMKRQHVRLLLAANYYNNAKVESIAASVGTKAVIVPMQVGGARGAKDYFSLIDLCVDRLVSASTK